MNQITRHRGPDGTGVFCDEGISLGHDRLSIIDLSDSAAQPMKSDDEKLVIVFNGEIYNFKELKKELIDFYKFKTQSDTEVLLASYKKWGSDCVKKLNGIFAFAIWDTRERELFLARDHIGVKPLYYFWDGKKFIFSSEIKAILEHNISRILNREALNHYLRVLYVPEPLTMFDGIKKLPPASRASLKGKKLEIDRYWDLEARDILPGDKKEIASELEKMVAASTKSQLISDRPLGIYLSGGIDSSVVLDSVARVRNNIDTFSVGFKLSKEEQSEKFNQDFDLARRTAKHYGTNHNEVLLGARDVANMLEKMVWHLDEPISNPTAIAMMKLAGFAKNKADVVLGGDGGDELFGGYERYRLSLMASYYQKLLPKQIRAVASNFDERLRKLNINAGVNRLALFMFQKDNILKRAVNAEFLSDETFDFFRKKYFSEDTGRKFEEVLMDTDRKSWLVDESLMMTDKMSMSAGLEARVPLLDKDLVEFAARIPLKYKVNLFDTKIILKEAFKDRIPNFLLDQPKRGWFSPGAKWIRDEKIFGMIGNILSENYYPDTSEMFSWNSIRTILDAHKEKREYNLNIIWSLAVFQIWARKYNISL